LAAMLGNLMYQTRPPDELIVLASDTPELEGLRKRFTPVLADYGIRSRWYAEENLNDWGHAKRDRGILLANCEWVGFFNDDDSYDNGYIEKMVAAGEQADIVYCDWTGIPDCKFRPGSSTSGNFIVRRHIAQSVGWNKRHYEADGAFIDGVKKKAGQIVKLPELLYRHNLGVARGAD
jgi:hypothetical protein